MRRASWLFVAALAACGSPRIPVGSDGPREPQAEKDSGNAAPAPVSIDAAVDAPSAPPRGTSWTRLFPAGDLPVPYLGGAVATDGRGALYVSGAFYHRGMFGDAGLDAGSGYGGFVARMDIDGDILWVRETVTDPDPVPLIGALFPSGRLFLAGNTWGTNESTRFLVLDGQGSTAWSGGSSSAMLAPSAQLANGHVLASVSGSASFAGGPSAAPPQTLVELDDAANVVRSLPVSLPRGLPLYALAGAPDGGWVAAGGENCVPTPCGITWATAPILGADLPERFLVSLGDDWRVRWSLRIEDDAYPRLITVDPAGNTYVSGEFGLNGTSVKIGVLSASVSAKGTDNIFLAKISRGGEPVWIRALYAAGETWQGGLATDEDGDVAIAGGFEGTLSVDRHLLVSRGSGDGFVALFDPNGERLLAQSFGDDANQIVLALALRRDAILMSGTFVLGQFSTQVNVGTGWIDHPGPAGQPAAFVTRILR
jgi:hypothetical protein